MTESSTIELYTQAHWHAAGAFALDRAGAEALIEGLKRFMETGQTMIEAFASDGESFDLHLLPLNPAIGSQQYLDCYEGWEPMDGDSFVYAGKIK